MTKTEQIFQLSCPFANEFQGPRKRLVFVCSAGMLRSPTAAYVATTLGYNARSCGSANYALIPLSVNLIEWAETIYFVNEENYYEALDNFQDHSEYFEMIQTKAVIWDIDDIYNYNDYSLKENIKRRLE